MGGSPFPCPALSSGLPACTLTVHPARLLAFLLAFRPAQKNLVPEVSTRVRSPEVPQAGRPLRSAADAPRLCWLTGTVEWGFPGRGARAPAERHALASLGTDGAGARSLIWWDVVFPTRRGPGEPGRVPGSTAGVPAFISEGKVQAKGHSLCLQVQMATQWWVVTQEISGNDK